MNMNHEEKSRKVWIVVLLGLLTAIGPLSMDMYLPALPIVASDLDTTASLAQLSLTACLIGLAAGQLIFGPLSDILGRKRPLLYTLAIYAVVSALCAFTANIWVFVLLRFIQGFTGAAGIVIARAAARDMYVGKELTKGICPAGAGQWGGTDTCSDFRRLDPQLRFMACRLPGHRSHRRAPAPVGFIHVRGDAR